MCTILTCYFTSFNVESALVLGMRAIGRGRAAAATLSAYVGLPSPVTESRWKRHHDVIGQNVR